ncbi:hypothetical protein [Alkalibacterium kapii]|uniref:ComK protein n=1 Tax=Alkalibacterium kapii TaxID=426704 RepID=A0A511ASA0_9LACT|nr:hypothetical protein [Alkalibacterium kapii]GEK90976.1 hypothetical protein AKA01nite_05980 [Alkalibacterium kapii]
MNYDESYKKEVFDRFNLYVNDSQKEASNYLEMSPPPAYTYLLDLTPGNMLEHIDLAIEQKYLLLNHETFYIYDLSKEKSTPYNTLVFQLTGSPLKSLETTAVVMSRYFKHLNIDYRWVRQFGLALRIKTCCPFVLGSYYFTPDRGVVKRPGNWIAFHHVRDMHPHAEGTLFSITKGHQLLTNQSFKHMKHLAHQTRLMAESQNKVVREWLELREKQKGTYTEDNIIDRLSTSSVFTMNTPPLSSWMMTIIYLQSLDLISQSLEEGDPLIDDIKKRHKKNLLADEDELDYQDY